jgi:hypothetical protein
MNAALPALERQAYNDIIQLGLNPADFLIAARIIPSVQNIVRLIHFATNRVNNPLLPHQDLSDPRKAKISIIKTSDTLKQAAKEVAGEKYVIKNEKLASVDTIIRSAALFLNAYTAAMDAFRNPDIYTDGQLLLNFLNQAQAAALHLIPINGAVYHLGTLPNAGGTTVPLLQDAAAFSNALDNIRQAIIGVIRNLVRKDTISLDDSISILLLCRYANRLAEDVPGVNVNYLPVPLGVVEGYVRGDLIGTPNEREIYNRIRTGINDAIDYCMNSNNGNLPPAYGHNVHINTVISPYLDNGIPVADSWHLQ